MIWFNLIIGLFLLLAGRRLFWLFVACIGFASGYYYAQQIWAIHSPVQLLILSVVAGAVGAIIGIFFQKAAIVVAGFAGGGYITLIFFDQFVGTPAHAAWFPYVIGGIIGAIIMWIIFDWALILLSTLAGAGLVVQTLPFKPWVEIPLFFILIVGGLVFQARTMPGARGK
jgi:hypothetical protein